MDGRLGNGSCVCDFGWGGFDCSKELKYAFIQKILAPDGAADDWLGQGDGLVLAAASHGDDDLSSDSDSIYVWHWNGSSYTDVQELLAADGAAQNWLGYNGLTLSGNGSLLAAASYGGDDIASVHIYGNGMKPNLHMYSACLLPTKPYVTG